MKKTYRMNRKLINVYMRRLKRWSIQWDLTGRGPAEARLGALLDVARERAWRAGPLPGRKLSTRLADFNKAFSA